MRVEMLTVGPFQSNCFIAACEETNEAIIVDACDEADRIVGFVRDNKLEVKMILETHAHIDHVSALAGVVTALSVPVLMHKNEMVLYENLDTAAMMFGLTAPETVKIDRFVKGGETIAVGKLNGRLIDTPGHSPGGLTLMFESADPPRAFVGDVLFHGSIGRTDLPGADHAVMISTLKNVIMKLPDSTVVYSGHGPQTTIGLEKMTNPFLTALV
jgi:hydroxyacylglutathione hydrolase